MKVFFKNQGETFILKKIVDFSCSMCDKTFRKSATLKVHDRIHTADKPFSCSKCNKTFRKSGLLKRHESVHTGDTPFSCSLCDKKFAQAYILKTHKRIHILKTPSRQKHKGKVKLLPNTS